MIIGKILKDCFGFSLDDIKWSQWQTWAIEENLKQKAIIEYTEMQPGDVPQTESDISLAKEDLNYSPTTPVSVGIPLFATWFKEKYDRWINAKPGS